MGKRLDVFPSSFTISTHADLYLELIVCFLSPSNNNISVKKIKHSLNIMYLSPLKLTVIIRAFNK